MIRIADGNFHDDEDYKYLIFCENKTLNSVYHTPERVFYMQTYFKKENSMETVTVVLENNEARPNSIYRETPNKVRIIKSWGNYK